MKFLEPSKVQKSEKLASLQEDRNEKFIKYKTIMFRNVGRFIYIYVDPVDSP